MNLQSFALILNIPMCVIELSVLRNERVLITSL